MDKLPNPFVTNLHCRFVLDEARFLADIEPPPAFIASPSREFLMGCGLEPVLEILDAH